MPESTIQWWMEAIEKGLMKYNLDIPLGFIGHKVYYFHKNWHMEIATQFLEDLTETWEPQRCKFLSIFWEYSIVIKLMLYMLRNVKTKKWLKNASEYLLSENPKYWDHKRINVCYPILKHRYKYKTEQKWSTIKVHDWNFHLSISHQLIDVRCLR